MGVAPSNALLFINMKTVYIFGNPLLDFDSMPVKLIPELQNALPQFNFIHQDPNDNLCPVDGELIIIDSVAEITEIKILTDISQIETSPRFSMHDLDLGFILKLMQKIGELKKVTIICVPMDIQADQAFRVITEELEKLISVSK
jgi:Ni,Fe-hydrogenase maturation factor